MIHEGFPGQRLQVLPDPVIEHAQGQVPTSLLLPTDVGHFPHARSHGRKRIRGARGAIVILCTDGGGFCESGGVRQTVRAGQALVIGPGVPHHYGAQDEDPWTIWWLHLTGSTVPVWMEEVSAAQAPAVLPVGDARHLTTLVAEIVILLESDTTARGLRQASGLAWQFLNELMVGDDRLETDEPVRIVQQHLLQNLSAQHRVADLADRVGLSSSHLAARFREATGGGIIEHLTGLRMARARELLGLTSMPVGEVAAEVGFTDAFYFSRTFRRTHGCSPSAFRARYTAN